MTTESGWSAIGPKSFPEAQERKQEFFDVVSRMRLPEAEWSAWVPIAPGLRSTPRGARTRMIRHAASLTEQGYTVVGINRLEITLETEHGLRTVVHMRKVD